ncbi:MAG: pyruvate kinase [bacterium]
MDTTKVPPKVAVSDFKKTKIIATVGPSTNSYEAILALIKAGANGLRLNFSHGTYEERIQQIKWIRKASKEYGKPVAIIQDLHGPKMQLGAFEGVLPVQTGQNLRFKFGADYERSNILPVQYDFSKYVKRGQKLLLYDGKIRTTITSIKDGVVYVTVENDGVLIKGKGINLPETDFQGDVLTDRDRKDIAFGSTQDFDYVAQSFVQTSEDIKKLRTILHNLGSKAKIIAKVETKAAIDNLELITKETDVIMVARGDLAVETSPESVPIMQRRMIGLGMQYAKPVIVATQMLATMTESPEPTRAEVSDVATAVLVGADCVMLSEETAAGKYPIEAVKVMKRVIKYTEENAPIKPLFTELVENTGRQNAICSAVISLAREVGATVIVAETKSGATALQISSRRPDTPIIAVTSQAHVCNQLAIAYGTKSFVRPDNKFAATKLTDWLRKSRVLSKGDVIVTASGQHAGIVGTTDTIKVRILE